MIYLNDYFNKICLLHFLSYFCNKSTETGYKNIKTGITIV